MEEESVAAVRVPGEFAGGPGGGHHLGGGHFAVDRRLLLGNAARVQALQIVQRHGQSDAHRRGRSARFHRPFLSDRNDLHSVVHVRNHRSHRSLSQPAQLLQRHDERHRHHGHHSLLHHVGHRPGRRREQRQRCRPTRAHAAGAQQQPGHVAGHPASHPARQSLSNIQIVPPLQGTPDSRSHAQGLHARTRTFNFFPIHR